MSAFSPLNLAEDPSSKKDLEEEHTREIEIENAFKVFQDAMLLEKAQDLTGSYLKFKELAKMDLVVNHYYEEPDFIRGVQNGSYDTQLNELSFLSQNVKSIRFLYFRNRGFLHFRILQGGANVLLDAYEADVRTSEPGTPQITLFEFSKELFYAMMDNFVNCIVYEEVDESLLRILHDIYAYLDVKRLARFTLEYAKTFPKESDDILSLLPLNEWVEPIWRRFEKEGLLLLAPTKDLSFLKDLKDDLYNHYEKKLLRNCLQILVKASAKWLDVINATNQALKQSQDRDKGQETNKLPLTYSDPYLASESTIDFVEFSFKMDEDPPNSIPHEVSTANGSENEFHDKEDTIEAANDPGPEDIEIKNPEKDMATEAPTSVEKTVQRSSRRLNPGDLIPDSDVIIPLVRNYYVETEVFFKQLNDCLTDIYELHTPILSDVVEHIIDDVPQRSSPLYIMDFLKALNEWKTNIYTPLLSNKSKLKTALNADSDKVKLIDVLTKFGNLLASETDSAPEFLDDAEESDKVRHLLTELPRVHIMQTKTIILCHLMDSISTLTWGDPLFKAVKIWVIQMESNILQDLALEQTGLSTQSAQLLAIGIYEILVDSYISAKQKIELSYDFANKGSVTKSVKSTFNASSIELLRLNDRIEKWKHNFFDAMFEKYSIESLMSSSPTMVVRYLWASNYLTASRSFTWKEKKNVVIRLQYLHDLIKTSHCRDIQIPFPNFQHIGNFSLESLSRRLSTSSILAIFTKILDNSDSKDDSSSDTISLLESILIKSGDSIVVDLDSEDSGLDDDTLVKSVIHGKASLNSRSLRSVKTFLDECPIDLSLSLWSILFLYYEEDSFSKFQKGFERNLEFVLLHLQSEKYRDSKGDRAILFLKALSFYSGYLKIFLRYLAANKWQLPRHGSGYYASVARNLSRVFEICYCFSLHEESALYSSAKVSLETKSTTAFQFFKDLLVESVTILLIYCINYIRSTGSSHQDETISTLLVLVHNVLGSRRLCFCADGLFLSLSEDTLVTLAKQPERELAQLLSCRFHYKIKLDGSFPVDHYTQKGADLDKAGAEELAAFILPLCFKKNPLIFPPRNDLKQIVDDLFDIIGEPDIESEKVLSANLLSLDTFLDHTDLGARFIKEAFHGLQRLEFPLPKVANHVATAGLYFLEAVLMFNLYKIRKKSAQSRTVELERIIHLLKIDLIHGSRRVESWILLGQAYGFIVEDDLIWTSDKLNIIDRKVVTANLQKKALVSYMMAINIITEKRQLEADELKPVIGTLMNSLVKELYSACRPPMDMIAFKAQNGSKFIRRKGQPMFQIVSEQPSVSLKFCFKLMYRCIKLAIKSNCNQWSSFYYLAKLGAKLKLEPGEVLKALVISNSLSRTQGSVGDPLLESLYKLCGLIYKYVKAGKLNIVEAMAYLRNEPALQVLNESDPVDKKSLYNIIITCLERISSLDKKGWYHKPSYRQAAIAFHDFNDTKRAKEILQKFFTLKSSNKTFLQVWKPENERPGKHFVYMYEYTRFYIEILTKEKDLASLSLLFPKLRRANSTMILLYFAWDKLCTSFCKIIREIGRIGDNYVETFMSSNTYTSFTTNARYVVDSVKLDGCSESVQPLLCYLIVLTEIRKLNSGYGPTSLIDDTISGTFLRIYQDFILKNPPPQSVDASNEASNAKSKRLAKKDILTYTIELATKCKKDTDTFLKDNMGIFSDYVSRYEAEEIVLRAQREEEERRQAEERRLATERRGWELQRKIAELDLAIGQKKAMKKMLEMTLPKTSNFFVTTSLHLMSSDGTTFISQDARRVPPPTVFITGPPKGFGKQAGSGNQSAPLNYPYGYQAYMSPYGNTSNPDGAQMAYIAAMAQMNPSLYRIADQSNFNRPPIQNHSLMYQMHSTQQPNGLAQHQSQPLSMQHSPVPTAGSHKASTMLPEAQSSSKGFRTIQPKIETVTQGEKGSQEYTGTYQSPKKAVDLQGPSGRHDIPLSASALPVRQFLPKTNSAATSADQSAPNKKQSQEIVSPTLTSPSTSEVASTTEKAEAIHGNVREILAKGPVSDNGALKVEVEPLLSNEKSLSHNKVETLVLSDSDEVVEVIHVPDSPSTMKRKSEGEDRNGESKPKKSRLDNVRRSKRLIG